MLMFVNILIFVLIILFLAMKISPITTTDYEIQRRIEKGDKRANNLAVKKRLIPIFNFILKFILIILGMLLILTIRESQDFIKTFLYSFGLMILAILLSTLELFQKISSNLLKKVQTQISVFYWKLGKKNQRRLLNLNKRKDNTTVFSRQELLFLAEKNPKILSSSEKEWLKKVVELADKNIGEVSTPKDKLKIFHQTDFLGPLVIDEMYKTGHNIFVVTENSESTIHGVLELSEIANLDNKTSQIAKNVMNRDFKAVEYSRPALDIFAEMISQNVTFVVVEQDGDFAGVVHLSDLLSQK